MEQRLIDANALKESFRKQTVNVQGKIKDDADAIIEAICKDVDLEPTVDAVPVDFIKALHTDYVQRSKALQGRTAYMYTLYAMALENLMQSFDYDNEIADIMRVERNCADGERRSDE